MTAKLEREPLTLRQRDIYRFIRKSICITQRPPTVREIAKHFKIGTPNGVCCHLRYLTDKGWIEMDANHSCGIRLTGVKVTIEDIT
jgi:repressor LexA